MSARTVIEAEGLRKTYGATVAVAGLDFSVHEGEICGLLGPNGSGKTTTILMLLGLTEPTGGRVSVLGHDPLRDPLAVKRAVGYMPDQVGFYDHLTARENLRYSAGLAGLPRGGIASGIEDALESVRLADVGDRKVSTFSRGMRQRLGLAEIVLKGARVAILDEPTSGLDPQSTHEFLDLIRGLKERGVAVLLSSHLLERVQSLCDRVFLFYKGRIVLRGAVPDLAREVLGGGYSILVEARDGDVSRVLSGLDGVTEVKKIGHGRYRIAAETDLRAEVARRLIVGGVHLQRLNVMEPSLDDIYARYFADVRTAA